MTGAAVERAHRAVAVALRSGDWAVDATVGRGHDTRFLAEQVGSAGRVDGLDIQPQALEAAHQRLMEADLAAWVWLHHGGHEALLSLLPGEARGKVQIVLFNLGYLPGGDKTRTTGPTTTVAALDAAWDLVAPGGRVVVVAYPGHTGGGAETAAVAEWADRCGSVRIASHHGGRRCQAAPPPTPDRGALEVGVTVPVSCTVMLPLTV